MHGRNIYGRSITVRMDGQEELAKKELHNALNPPVQPAPPPAAQSSPLWHPAPPAPSPSAGAMPPPMSSQAVPPMLRKGVPPTPLPSSSLSSVPPPHLCRPTPPPPETSRESAPVAVREKEPRYSLERGLRAMKEKRRPSPLLSGKENRGEADVNMELESDEDESVNEFQRQKAAAPPLPTTTQPSSSKTSASTSSSPAQPDLWRDGVQSYLLSMPRTLSLPLSKDDPTTFVPTPFCPYPIVIGTKKDKPQIIAHLSAVAAATAAAGPPGIPLAPSKPYQAAIPQAIPPQPHPVTHQPYPPRPASALPSQLRSPTFNGPRGAPPSSPLAERRREQVC